jgi:hypothetical protein
MSPTNTWALSTLALTLTSKARAGTAHTKANITAKKAEKRDIKTSIYKNIQKYV